MERWWRSQELGDDRLARLPLWQRLGLVVLAIGAGALGAAIVNAFVSIGSEGIVLAGVIAGGSAVYRCLWLPARRSGR